MKKAILLISVTSVLAGLFPAKAQQIPQFSQYMFNGLYVNPAYAGYKENMYAHFVHRNQWVGIDGSPKTTMLSIDGRIAGGSNLGLVFANDVIGPFATNSLMLSYSFRFNTSDISRLSFGLSGGALHYGIDKDKVGRDPLAETTENEWRPGVDIGVYFDMPHFYAGLSVMSLVPNKTEANRSLLIMRTDPSCFLTVGGAIPLTRSLALMPSTLLKTDFKSPIAWDINAMLMIVERYWIGASYRTGLTFALDDENLRRTQQRDAIALIAEAYITERIRIGIAYDFDLNNLTTNHNGSFEVSVGYYLTGPKRVYSTPRYF
ncbi:MAG: type IX secretion system membrane protein PorP/SprF [Prevotellaceae bacterium]|jgi:type IX secretion system PorP/SprF family membrane protein|nr:type IX secretion system membrane protein PorP/SprF [Prevotellaceae bacterium]